MHTHTNTHTYAQRLYERIYEVMVITGLWRLKHYGSTCRLSNTMAMIVTMIVTVVVMVVSKKVTNVVIRVIYGGIGAETNIEITG